MKKKILFGIGVILLGIFIMVLGGFALNSVPNVESLTPKEGFIMFGTFMLFLVGAGGIVCGCTLIGWALDE